MFSLSYRNRELANLFVVAILTGLGFASVYIARQDVISTGSLSYALFFFGLIMPNFNALAMEPMGRIAGTASSFVGAITTALAAAIGAYVGLHYAGTVTPLLAGFAGCGLAGLAIVLVTERGRLFRVGS